MEVTEIIAEIDAQIANLQKARELLGGSGDTPKRGPGRPRGSKATAKAAAPSTGGKRKKRQLTPEGRKRIADAMKRRWAERRKAMAK